MKCRRNAQQAVLVCRWGGGGRRGSWAPPSLFQLEWNPPIRLGHFPELLLQLLCLNLSKFLSFCVNSLSSFICAFFLLTNRVNELEGHTDGRVPRRGRVECTKSNYGAFLFFCSSSQEETIHWPRNWQLCILILINQVCDLEPLYVRL